jgi:hypothetical protein
MAELQGRKSDRVTSIKIKVGTSDYTMLGGDLHSNLGQDSIGIIDLMTNRATFVHRFDGFDPSRCEVYLAKSVSDGESPEGTEEDDPNWIQLRSKSLQYYVNLPDIILPENNRIFLKIKIPETARIGMSRKNIVGSVK